jgi:hypothetical protein
MVERIIIPNNGNKWSLIVAGKNIGSVFPPGGERIRMERQMSIGKCKIL